MDESNVTTLQTKSERQAQLEGQGNEVICELDRARAILNTFIKTLDAGSNERYGVMTVDSIVYNARNMLDRLETDRAVSRG